MQNLSLWKLVYTLVTAVLSTLGITPVIFATTYRNSKLILRNKRGEHNYQVFELYTKNHAEAKHVSLQEYIRHPHIRIPLSTG